MERLKKAAALATSAALRKGKQVEQSMMRPTLENIEDTLTHFIKKMRPFLGTEGLFRIPGSTTDKDTILIIVRTNSYNPKKIKFDVNDGNIYAVADAIKAIIEDAIDHRTSASPYGLDGLMCHASESDEQNAAIKTAIKTYLTSDQKRFLSQLFSFFEELLNHKNDNKLSIESLCIYFAPRLFIQASDPMEILQNSKTQITTLHNTFKAWESEKTILSPATVISGQQQTRHLRTASTFADPQFYTSLEELNLTDAIGSSQAGASSSHVLATSELPVPEFWEKLTQKVNNELKSIVQVIDTDVKINELLEQISNKFAEQFGVEAIYDVLDHFTFNVNDQGTILITNNATNEKLFGIDGNKILNF